MARVLIDHLINCINGNIVRYVNRYISRATSNRCIIMAARRLDGHMALNGDISGCPAIANGRAVDPGCYDPDIFIRSACCANDHRCLGIISTQPGSADSSSIASPTIIAALCNDRCMVTDHDAPCRATVSAFAPTGTTAADGSAI